jgi:hypothetical protein
MLVEDCKSLFDSSGLIPVDAPGVVEAVPASTGVGTGSIFGAVTGICDIITGAVFGGRF